MYQSIIAMAPTVVVALLLKPDNVEFIHWIMLYVVAFFGGAMALFALGNK